jgi:hypothetical protein
MRVTIHGFTGTQAGIVTGDKVRSIVGAEAADRICRRFQQRRPDVNGIVLVDLGDDELAVIAALREISPDATDSDEQQSTETLLKRLTSDRDGPG